MAVKDIRQNIEDILTSAEKKTRVELSKGKIECYVYNRKYIREWCKWSANQAGINRLKRSILTKMINEFFDVLVAEFKHTNDPYHFAGNKSKEIVITKVRKSTATREKTNSKERKSTKRAKNKALDILEKEAKVTIPNRVPILSGLHGHHGGPLSSDPKTTLQGMVAVRDNMPKSDRELEDLLDETSQITTDDLLRDVIIAEFNAVIDAEMTVTKSPKSGTAKSNRLYHKGHKDRNKKVDFNLDKEIQITFALGKGAKGKKYTDALADWDAEKSGGFPPAIDRILDEVSEKVLKFIRDNMKPGDVIDEVKLKGSPSILDKLNAEVPKQILGGLFPHKISPDMRLKVNKRLFNKQVNLKKTKATARKPSVGGKEIFLAKSKLPQASKTRTQGRQTREPGLELKELINNVLPEAVAAKMIEPALRFRTGRFANSAEVTNVTVGPRGGTEIQYTYQRDPYETFEPGNKRGSVQRDPRKLIGSTVREIAQQMVGKKFIRTRRV